MREYQRLNYMGGVVTPVPLHTESTELTPDHIIQRLTPYLIQNIDIIMEEKMETLNDLIKQVGDITQLKEEINELNQKLSNLIAEDEEEPNVVYIREISKENAKEEIKGYFRGHDGDIFPSDISIDLGIPYELVWEVIRELEEEGEIEAGD